MVVLGFAKVERGSKVCIKQFNMTTTEALAIFEKALDGSNYSPRTIRAYTDDVKQYLAFVKKEELIGIFPAV